jgi:Protein of unknown function (DUF998)
MRKTSAMGAAKTAALPSIITVIGISYVVMATVIMHVLRPDLDLLSRPLSEYAVGRYGALFTSALLVWGIAALIFAAGLHRGVMRSGWLSSGLLLLVVFAVGLIGAGLFPMDVPFPPEHFSLESFTRGGLIHVLSATVASACFPFAALFLSKSFQKDARWRSIHRRASMLALGSLAASASLFIISSRYIEFFGLVQRLLAAFAWSWILLTAIRLHALAPESVSG